MRDSLVRRSSGLCLVVRPSVRLRGFCPFCRMLACDALVDTLLQRRTRVVQGARSPSINL